MQDQTILFADQVGSTKLLADIGDEAMVAVHNRLWSIFTTAVADHGGEVLSDEGDGGSAVFDSASAAARAALEMVDASHQPQDTASFELRLAIHTGPVIRTTGAAVGLAVHLTARLCDEAPPGFVLSSDKAAAELADDREIRITPFGQRTMKGIPEPLAVNLLTLSSEAAPSADVQVRGAPINFRSSPLLDQTSTRDLFVGRSSELEHMRQALLRAHTDAPEIVLIEGAPGTGKSTLTHRLCAVAIEMGAVCLIGRSDEALHDPFHEIIEMLQHAVADAPLPLLAEHVVRNGSLLTRLLPSLGDRVPSASLTDLDPTPDLRRLFDAVADLIRSMSREQPVVLVLEDVHWASSSSLELFRFLLREALLGPVLLVSTHRESELVAGAEPAQFVTLVADEPNASALSLDSFDTAAVTELCAESLELAPDVISELGGALHRHTGGNPLFCAEMLRTLSADQRLADAAPSDVASLLGVPRSVQHLALRRVERLGPEAAAVLTDAALLGETFDFHSLRRLGDEGSSSSASILAALDGAERVGLIRSDDTSGLRYTFGHALVQRALYDSMSTPARISRHRRAADAIQGSKGGVTADNSAEMLRHLQRSGVLAEPHEIIETAAIAADAAAAKLALNEAIRLRRLVVDTVLGADGNETDELAEAWLELGRMEAAALRVESRTSMANAAAVAAACGNWELHAVIAVEYGGSLKENQAPINVVQPVALIEASLARHQEPSATRSRLLMSLALWQRQHRPYAVRRPLVDEAMAYARSVDDPRLLATLLADHHRALHGPNTAEEALAISHELEALAIPLDDDLVAFHALNWRVIASLGVGAWEEAVTAGSQLGTVGDRLRNIEGRRISIMWKIVQTQISGDFRACREHISEISELLESYPNHELLRFLAVFNMPGIWLTGNFGLIYKSRSQLDPPESWLAWFASESGNLVEANGHLDRAGPPRGIEEKSDYLWWLDAVALTRSASILGRVDLAEEIYDVMLPYRSHNSILGVACFLGTAEHHLGTLSVTQGRFDVAVDHFERALERYEAMDAVPFIALARAELSNALTARGRTEDATLAAELRQQADSVARSHRLALVTTTLEAR